MILPKSCPFCGSVRVEVCHASAIAWHVHCFSCQAEGPSFTLPDYSKEKKTLRQFEDELKGKATAAWNRRAK